MNRKLVCFASVALGQVGCLTILCAMRKGKIRVVTAYDMSEQQIELYLRGI